MVFRPLLCSRRLLITYQQRLLNSPSCLQRLYSTHFDASFKDSLLDYSITRDINALVSQLPKSGEQTKLAPFYNAVLNKCVLKHEIDHVQQVTTLMRERGINMDTASYNILMRLQISRRGISQEELFEAYGEMLSRSVEPNIASFNTFIKYACQNHHWNTILQWLELMKNRSLVPNKITAQTIFRHLVLEPENTNLIDALDYIVATVSIDNESFLATGIVALLMENRKNLALELLNTLFQLEQPRFVRTYNIMITALCRQGDLKTAHKVLHAMIHDSKIPNPDIISFTSLIHGIVKCGDDEKEQLDAIVILYKKLLDFGLKSNNVLNSVIMIYFVKTQDLRKTEAIEQMCDSILNNKEKVNLPRQHGDTELIEMYIFNMMIEFYFAQPCSRKQSQIPRKPFILLQHAIEQRKLTPTISTLNIFVRGLTEYHQDLNAAETIVEFFEERGIKKNERTLWFMVKYALKQRKEEKALEWIQDYEKNHVIEGEGLLWFKSKIMKWSTTEKKEALV